MGLIHGLDNGQMYVRRDGSKPIEQTLDEKWFLWLSDDKHLKTQLQTQARKQGTRFGVIEAADYIHDVMVTRLISHTDAAVGVDLLQTCLDYTDWLHLATRLCTHFAIDLHIQPPDLSKKWVHDAQ